MKRFLLALVLLSLQISSFAATGTISPSPFQLVLDNNGNPINQACVWTYLAGTSTPVTTYNDVNLAVPNANPIIINATGRYTAFLTPGVSYKFVYERPTCNSTTHGAVLLTADNISAMPTSSGNLDILGTAGEALTAGQVVYLSDGSGGQTAGSWYKADADFSYASIFPLVGIAPNDIAAVTVGTIRLAGQATGLSSLAVGSTYYVSATAGSLTNTAPANRRIVGVADSTSTLSLFPALPTSASTSTVTTTGTQIALPIPSGSGNLVLFLNNGSLLTLQGITAGADGQRLTIYSTGAGNVSLAHQNGSAVAANRLINFATSGASVLAAGSGQASFVYDGTAARWRLETFEQGAWITPTFNAGDFTGGGSLTWTVQGADVKTLAYWLKGRSLTLQIAVETTTTGGTAANTLNISNAEWGGFTCSKQFGATATLVDATTESVGRVQGSAAGTTISFVKTSAANWSNAATDTTYVYANVSFEVN